MGCASGKKISRCAIVKDFEPRTSNQDHQETHSASDIPSSSPMPYASIAPVSTAFKPQAAAPVAALLSQPSDPPPRAIKPLPPKKTVEPIDFPDATVVERSKFAREKSKDEQFRRHNSQVVISGYESMLPAAKDLVNAKHTFDKGRFRQLNPAPSKQAALPPTIEEKLEEIQLFGAITDPHIKPQSTLVLPARRQTSVFTGSGLPVIVRPAETRQ